MALRAGASACISRFAFYNLFVKENRIGVGFFVFCVFVCVFRGGEGASSNRVTLPNRLLSFALLSSGEGGRKKKVCVWLAEIAH